MNEKHVKISFLLVLFLFVALLFMFANAVGAEEPFPTLAPPESEWKETVTAQAEKKLTKTPAPTQVIIYWTSTPDPYPTPEVNSWFDDLLELFGIR